MPTTALQPEQSLAPLPTPETVSEVGVNKSLLEDLALKTIYVTAPGSLVELSTTMRLHYRVVDEIFRRLRGEQMVEVTGMTGNTRQIALTTAGRNRALDLLALNQYVGAAPISLSDYVEQVKKQSVRNFAVHPADVREAFGPLVLEQKILDKLGTALNSGASIFLYGPTGSGKTAIATTLPRVLHRDQIWIPHALQADGQIIVVYDPHTHTKIEDDSLTENSDPRWVLCRRPTVLVGGELTIDMLDLQLNPIAKYYTAPVQMKANNGVLIVDDFGRQRVRPEDLLNRWVVPLDRGIDFLALAGGRKIEIPFELYVVFATNLNPSTLADAAFLRRIQTKIRVGTSSRQQFHEVFQRVCAEWGLNYDSQMVDELIELIRKKHREPLRNCHPRDIVGQIRWRARYEDREPRLDWESLLAAVDSYFVPEEPEEEETEGEPN